ncbi:SGNH/GDSL hydrolase family protein [Loktanella sp. TSTF-M6]|uniref:SGNH/GDSL hydrolase family protein n=1 Tax=Loktanella gaetbuli TaxID=2881335 RepID=A0ABS8BSY2_9RHOB|nr:SGNH/GDSL hydrolase family protein [Loktanella gaetbuli]MCB5198833.1 SGNH/GDSL hydrolase family protein [Loktanella gaetbuli]
MRAVASVVCALLAGCAPPQTGPVTITAVGDSVLSWNRLSGQDIPRVAAAALDRGVANRSVPGARFLTAIPAQYRAGDWDWVIVNGGANDLSRDCGCDGCDFTLDALISADGQTGAMPRFVRDIADRGPRVLVLGYYGTSVAGGPLADCADELTELSTRLATLAARDPRIVFVDAKDAIDPANLDLYARDLVHPSAQGSALIGAEIARAITMSDPRAGRFQLEASR